MKSLPNQHMVRMLLDHSSVVLGGHLLLVTSTEVKLWSLPLLQCPEVRVTMGSGLNPTMSGHYRGENGQRVVVSWSLGPPR